MKTKDATPLLAKLIELSAEIDRVFEPEYDPGLGQLGLLFSQNLKNGGYWCTPENSVSFGGTGGDGIHFSLLMIDGQVTDFCPVFMTVPMPGGEDENFFLGENLMDFIRFGLNQGLFPMEKLSYVGEAVLESFSVSASSSSESDKGDDLSEADFDRSILNYIGRKLNILPLSYSLEEFRKLQDKYRPMIRYSDEYYQVTRNKKPNENH